VSFDPNACSLKYGMGHHMEETTLLAYRLPEELTSLFRASPKVVSLLGYGDGPVEPRSIFEAKLRALEGYEVLHKHPSTPLPVPHFCFSFIHFAWTLHSGMAAVPLA
jgi:hypothetical protein